MVRTPTIFPSHERRSIGGTARAAAALATLALLLAAGACERPPAPPAAAPARPGAAASAPGGGPLRKSGSLLVITLDTTRRDFMGFMGHAPTLTPRLDEFAQECVLFEDAFTVAPLTLPAHTSLMTGLYPLSHRLRDNGLAALPESAVTLAEALQAAGYATGAAVASFVLDRCFGLAQGFSTWHEPPRQPGRGDLYVTELPADRMVDLALADLAQVKSPYFYWLHLFDAHFPYAAPGSVPRPTHNADEAREERRRLYGEEIAFLDRQVGRLLDQLRARPDFATLTVVVTADHGESLGDGREPTHGYFLYDPTVRVPLLIRHPGAPPRRVAAQVSLVDLMPTLLELLGQPRGELRFDGASVAELVRGTSDEAPERTVAFETWYGYANFGWAPLEGCVVGPIKFLRARERRLFDRSADPAERENLWRPGEPRARVMEARLDALLGHPAAALVPDGIELTPSDAAALARTGYVNASELDLTNHPDGSTLDEPEDHLDDILILERVNSAFVAGDKEEALSLSRTLLERMPKSVILHEQLASLLLTLRTPESQDEAERHLHAALALDFRRGKNHYNLGLLEMRRMAAAERALAAAKARRDEQGEAAAQAEADQRRGAAIESFRRALALDATSPETLANLAALLHAQALRLPPSSGAERSRLLLEAVALYERFLAAVPSGHPDRKKIEEARDADRRLAESSGGR
jgi:tetratricopeptide (TPR) repeat protein